MNQNQQPQINVIEMLSSRTLHCKPKVNLELIFSDKTEMKIEGTLEYLKRKYFESRLKEKDIYNLKISNCSKKVINELWLNGQVQSNGYTYFRDIRILRKHNEIKLPLESENYHLKYIKIEDKIIYLNDRNLILNL